MASASIACARFSVRVFHAQYPTAQRQHGNDNGRDQPEGAPILVEPDPGIPEDMGQFVFLKAVTFRALHKRTIISSAHPSAVPPSPTSSLRPLALPYRRDAYPVDSRIRLDDCPMRFRTWPVVAVSLLGLLGLIVVSILAAQRKADLAYAHLESLNSRYRDVEMRVRRMRADLHLSGILARDYLLDRTTPAGEYRSRLLAYRTESDRMIEELEPLVRDSDPAQFDELRQRAGRLLAFLYSAVRRQRPTATGTASSGAKSCPGATRS